MSDSTIFLFGAIMYLIGLGAMLFKDEFTRLGLRGSLGGLTCGSLLPVVTARARCIPVPADFTCTCTHRVPAGVRP